MDSGYLKLYRKFTSNPLWKEKRVFSKAEAWIDILFSVRYSKEPEKILIKNKLLICNCGESLKSISTWSKRWGWSESKVKRFLNLLKDLNQIQTVNEKITNRLIVCNYKSYNVERTEDEPKADHKRTESGLKADTEEEGSKKDVRKKEYIGEKSKRFIPPTLNEVKQYCEERKNNVDSSKFVDFYTSKNWYVGKNKMKDWKASVRTWEKNSYSKHKNEVPEQYNNIF